MLNIQVLGRGMVPRKGFLAPHKQPFPADLKEIGLIMQEPNLQIRYLNPETNSFVPLDRNNLMSVWNRYGTKRPIRPSRMMPMKSTAPPADQKIVRGVDTQAVSIETPPQDKPAPAVEKVVTETKVEEKVEVKTEEKVEEVKTEKVEPQTPPKDDIVLPKTDAAVQAGPPNDDIIITKSEDKKDDTFTPRVSKKRK